MKDTQHESVLQGPSVRELHEIGYDLHHLKEGKKEPIGGGWTTRSPMKLVEIEKGLAGGKNLGMRPGNWSKTPAGFVHVIDLDIRAETKVQEAFEALRKFLPDFEKHPAVQSGSGGLSRHIHIYLPEPLPINHLAWSEEYTPVWDASKKGFVDKRCWEIDLCGIGKNVVMPGSIHPDTGKQYIWVNPPDIEAIREGRTLPVQVEPLKKLDLQPQAPPSEPIDPQRLGDALTWLDPSKLRYHEWRNVGMGLHYESGGAEFGFELYNKWSALDPRPDPKEGYPGESGLRTIWRSFRKRPKRPITGATILSMARSAEIAHLIATFPDLPDNPEDGLLDLNAPFDVASVIAELLGPDPRDDADLSALEDKPDATKLKFLSPAQCATQPKRGYIIKGLLAPRDIVTCVGTPGCGKSTLAPYLGYMVAQGRETFGRRTKQGGVFYVAAEDETGLQMRVAALRGDHGDANDFQVVAGVSNLLVREAPDLLALREAAKSKKPSLIIIDTLAMAFPGLEENDAAAMGRVVAVARSLTKWGAAVILIHHDTKTGDGIPRGSSVLNGALDANLALKRSGKSVTGKLSKNRNGSCDIDIFFEIEAAHLGEDEDGDAITAAICRPPTDDFAEIRNPKERAFMSALYSIQERDDVDNVCEKALRVELSASSALSQSVEKEAQRKAFQRVKQSLLGQGFLSHDEAAKTLKPLYPIDMCLPDVGLGHAGQNADSAKRPSATGKGQLGHTP